MVAQTLLILLAGSLGAGRVAAPVDTLVVCPETFRPALAAWVDHRTAQGHRVAFVSPRGTSEQIRAAMHARCGATAPRFIVLVGDAAGYDPRKSALEQGQAARDTPGQVPTHYVEAKVNLRWDSELEIPSDNWYADWDHDQIPDAAIGRLPADSPAELAALAERIIRYETSLDSGDWHRRVNFVAGVGGFGSLVDGLLESGVKNLVTDRLPAEYATSLTFASWQSPYCPDPRRFCDVTLDRFNEGCLFWVYIGHGHRRWVDLLRVPDRPPYRILTYQEVNRLRAAAAPPIACFFACYTSAFDGREDCLAEEMLRQPGGPVAVIGGSRVTMPYGLAVFGRELLGACFQAGGETLGEAMLLAKRRSIEPAAAEQTARRLLDALATLVSPPPADLPAERLEHLHLINLLGDPLLRIARPQAISVVATSAADPTPTANGTADVPGALIAGPAGASAQSTDSPAGGAAQLAIQVDAPFAGRCSIELVARRDHLPIAPPRRDRFDDSPTARAQFDRVYAAANQLCWCRRVLDVAAPGALVARLDIPPGAAGPGHVRVYLAGQSTCAAGSCDVVLPAAPAAQPSAPLPAAPSAAPPAESP